MTRVLVVEDNDNKRSQILSFLRDSYPKLSISVARSLQNGLRMLKNDGIDFVILDMTLPNYDQGPEEDGGVIHALGGQEFLRKMKRAKIVTPVVVLTQFETFGTGENRLDLATLRMSLKDKYADICVDTIYYNSAVDAWKRQL
jgi:CheY-like chemotaxis protein